MSEQTPGIESLRDTIELIDDPGQRPELVVVNRREPDAVQDLFEEVFAGQVSITEAELPGEVDNVVLLVRDDEVVAASPLEAVMNSVLLVNSDIFRTGLAGVEKHRLPPVLANLNDVALTLRGYPESNKEKLLFIAMSREIEARALDAGDGRLDAAFQNLLRIEDEFGTQRVYRRLAASDVDVHVYGTHGEDWLGDELPGLSVTIADTEEYRRSWFVVHTPESGDGGSAFVAWETGPNVWQGGWTYDPDHVDRIHRYVVEEF